MQLSFRRPYLSITSLPTIELPSFTILTGRNGAGKSHLLKAISESAISVDIVTAASQLRSYDWTNLHPKDEPDFDVSAFQQRRIAIRSRVNELKKQDWAAPNIFEISRQLEFAEDKRFDLNWLANASDEELYASSGKKDFTGNSLRAHLKIGFDQFLDNIYGHFNEEDGKILRDISRRVGKSPILLSEDDYFNVDKPEWGQADIFQQSFAQLFTLYRRLMQENFLKSFGGSAGSVGEDRLTDAQFTEKYGTPPWEFVNDSLAAAGLDFSIEAPALKSLAPYRAKLKKNGSGAEISFSSLSSGERVLMSFAFAVYYASDRRQEIVRPKVLLLDEIDAPLHPSMSRNLISTIEKVMVGQHGLQVILTTHSPSTVALSPEEAIYVMRAGSPGLHKVSKSAAIRDLTDGVPTLSLSFDGRRQIFVESPTDVNVYQASHSALKRKIASEIMPIFVATGVRTKAGDVNTGCQNVIRIVSELRQGGAERTFGLIDWDGSNRTAGGIFVLAEGRRNGMESVLFDPLLLLNALVRAGGDPDITALLGEHETYLTLERVPVDRIQDAVNVIQKKILGSDSAGDVEEEYVGGLKLRLDKRYLEMDDHDLEASVFTAFPLLKQISRGRTGGLQEWIASTILAERAEHAPKCLLDIMLTIVAP